MASMTNFASDKVMNNWLTGGAAYAPAAIYIGLSTTSPGAGGSTSGEPTIGSNSYARVQLAQNTSTIWTAAASGAITNGSGAISFPQSSGAWAAGAALAYWFIIDDPTAGNVIFYGTVTGPNTVTGTGQTLKFAISNLNLTMA